MLFLMIKLVHIMLAVTAIGANLTYGVWFARANADPAAAPFAVRTIELIDSRIANPSYILLLPTGALMVWLSGLSFGTHWVAAAMILWLVAIVIAYAGYSPILRRQLAAVEREGVLSPNAQRLGVQGLTIAGVLAVIVFVIVVLMVFRPS
jgi:uncharacterized membrane protein